MNMMPFYLRPRLQPCNNIDQIKPNISPATTGSHTFIYGGNPRPKMLYIDIIGNTKPGCKRCGK